MTSDAALKSAISGYKADKAKYEKVKNEIVNHSLSTRQNLKEINSFLDYCEDIIELAEGEEGYHYIDVLPSNLKKDVKTMKQYRDFARDANTSFINLYNLLESKIASLDSKISRARDEYNKDKPLLEKLYW
ncbi:hypothetical protein [Streptococcus oricebi]|uniref:Relaxase n=1 Tax=Streptococcus oricebi TaxID=1547447 RepID=A0ABS5B5T6_9STRE|nr:hypothetical protein [Streptococcus oricebi]MBP2624204.1 hypothetical protein [Streptococcus oricebi]